jgi:hypothetical protein
VRQTRAEGGGHPPSAIGRSSVRFREFLLCPASRQTAVHQDASTTCARSEEVRLLSVLPRGFPSGSNGRRGCCTSAVGLVLRYRSKPGYHGRSLWGRKPRPANDLLERDNERGFHSDSRDSEGRPPSPGLPERTIPAFLLLPASPREGSAVVRMDLPHQRTSILQSIDYAGKRAARHREVLVDGLHGRSRMLRRNLKNVEVT